jgi:dTDP-4-dehydrorhamnose 3,5-epimerase
VKIDWTPLKDAALVTPIVYRDFRGEFLESWNMKNLECLKMAPFVQKNISRSKRGVLRGLHLQRQKPQGKLVQVLSGEVQDVIVDLRRSSPTFGRHFSVHLTPHVNLLLWVPEGFAHGFLVLSDQAEFCYYVTDYYDKNDEVTIRYDDPDLAIDWALDGVELLISNKDMHGCRFCEVAPFD